MTAAKDASLEVVCAQLHYTSCRHGLLGSPGFQTRAMSNNISAQDKEDIQRLVMYKPPRDFPSQPTTEQILNEFPVAMRHNYLESGKLVICRSCYVGLDYSNRWGNFFSHAIVIDNLPPLVWPTDIYEWRHWTRGLTQEEDIEQDSYALPAVSVIPDQESFSLEVLKEFLDDDDSRSDRLANMINAVQLRCSDSRNIVIRNEYQAEALFWIACLQKSFPSTLQRDLSCSSYHFDPRSSLAVNAIYGETDFSVEEDTRNYQYYVFDFVDNNFSSVEGGNVEYSKTITDWMQHAPDKLTKFHQFSTYFNTNIPLTDTGTLLSLFNFSESPHSDITKDELVTLLDFSNQYTRNECFENILNIFTLSVNELIHSDDPYCLSPLTEFFLNSFTVTKDLGLIDTVNRILFRLLISVINREGFSRSDFQNLINKGRDVAENFEAGFSNMLLGKEYVTKLIELTVNNSDTIEEVVMEFLAAINHSKKPEPALQNRCLLELIDKVVINKLPDLNNLDCLFSPLTRNAPEMAQLGSLVAKFTAQEIDRRGSTERFYDSAMQSLSAYFSKITNQHGDEYYYSIIKDLKNDPDNWALLEYEWKYNLKHNRKKLDFYKSYYSVILSQPSEFSSTYRPEFAEVLWQELAESKRQQLAILWLHEDHLDYMPKSLRQKVLNEANTALILEPNIKDNNALAVMIDQQALNYGMSLAPDMPTLLEAINLLYGEQTVFDAKKLKALKTSMQGINKQAYDSFIENYLTKVLTLVDQRDKVAILVSHLLIPAYEDIFLKGFKNFLSDGKKNKFSLAEEVVLIFWVSVDIDKNTDHNIVRIQPKAIELLVDRIAKLDDRQFEKLLNKTKKPGPKPKHLDSLIEVFKQVEVKKDTFVRRMMGRIKTVLKNTSPPRRP